MLFLGLYTAEYERTFVPDELRQVMSRFGRYERYDCSSKDPPSPQELLRRLAPADVALTGWPTPRFPEALADLPERRLKYICHLAGAVGYFLPRRYLEAGILCTNWGDRGIWPFAEGALALMLACLKAAHRIGRHMRTSPGTAFPFPHPSPTLRDKRVGFVGYGAIARTLTRMLRPMLCRFGVYDPYAQDLPEDAPAGPLAAEVRDWRRFLSQEKARRRFRRFGVTFGRAVRWAIGGSVAGLETILARPLHRRKPGPPAGRPQTQTEMQIVCPELPPESPLFRVWCY